MIRLPDTILVANKRVRRHKVLIQVTGAAVGFVLLKLLVRKFGLDIISLHPLFSALVAACVFLLSFLLNGVLSDYKESERLPGEISSALMLLFLEVKAIPVHSPGAAVLDHLESIRDLGAAIIGWVRGDVKTDDVNTVYVHTHAHVVEASVWLQHSSLRGRLMIEMASILRAINRIEVIRETEFAALVYWLAHSASVILCGGLVLARPGDVPMLDSQFFLFCLSWLLIFILHLINDLDNPFGFSDPFSAEDVDLEILYQNQRRMERLCQRLS